MTAHDLTKLVLANAAILAILQVLATMWLKARLEGSIKHEYDVSLEKLRRDLDRRERAAAIAALFAEWVAPDRSLKELNRLAWEASLWLPASIANDVNRRLSNAPDAPQVQDILVEVRSLLEAEGGAIAAGDIGYFMPEATQQAHAADAHEG